MYVIRLRWTHEGGALILGFALLRVIPEHSLYLPLPLSLSIMWEGQPGKELSQKLDNADTDPGLSASKTVRK